MGYFLAGLALIILYKIVLFLISENNQKQINIVLKNSKYISAILELNNKMGFKYIKYNTEIIRYAESKANYDRTNIYDVLRDEIISDMNYYESFLQIMERFKSNRSAYLSKVKDLSRFKGEFSGDALKINKNRLLQIEADLARKLIIPEISLMTYKVTFKYTSPAGRNSYGKYIDFNYNDIMVEVISVKNKIAQQSTRQNRISKERRRLTPSLRYKILRRDGMRCQICGSQQSDGVKLHVDHIIPVSKDGRTVPENLRTLCDRCNIGKSDRIEIV